MDGPASLWATSSNTTLSNKLEHNILIRRQSLHSGATVQQPSVINTLLFCRRSAASSLMFGCPCWRSSKGTGRPRATELQVLDAFASPTCCDKAWCNLEGQRWWSSFSGYPPHAPRFKMRFPLTFSTTDAVVDDDVLLLPPVFTRQCASVVGCCVEVVRSVVWEDVPTVLIGCLGQQSPICCHKLTAEGWIRSGTVCIMAV